MFRVNATIKFDSDEFCIDNIADDTKGNLLFGQLSLTQDIDWHHTFEIRIAVDGDTSDGKLTAWQQFTQLKERIGQFVTIGFDSRTDKDEIAEHTFKGVVTNLSFPQYSSQTGSIVLYGYGMTYLLDNSTHYNAFTEKNLSKIVKTILDKHGKMGESKVEPISDDTVAYYLQYNESDFRFLNRLAMTYNEWFFDDGEKLTFGKLPDSESIPLYLEGNLSSLDMSLKLLPHKTKWQTYSETENQILEYSTTKNDVSSDLSKCTQTSFMLDKSDEFFQQTSLIWANEPTKDKTVLKEQAIRRKLDAATHSFVLKGTSTETKLKIGSLIEVYPSTKKNTASRGKFRIVHLTHIVDGSGDYQNHFEAVSAEISLPPFNTHIQQPIAQAQLAVIEANDDDAKLGRVKVRFLWQTTEGDLSPWIQVLSPHTGNHTGFYFTPELQSKVWIGFNRHNPNHPYVMGSIWHNDAKPSWHTSNNTQKAIRTKSGHLICFNDGEQSLHIENKDSFNQIILSFKEEKIILQSEGDIEMTAKNIRLNAEEEISMNGTQKVAIEGKEIDIKGQQKASIEAVDIQVKASNKLEAQGTQTSIKGDAQAELTSSGMTVIKGGMVHIN